MDTKRQIAQGVLRGVVTGHTSGIVHKDIKPSNIMLTSKFIPKVCDWGLSSQYGRVGTKLYMAPELF